jgi:hypothetical protein
MHHRPPTDKQMRYLKRLCNERGRTFVRPSSLRHASWLIDQLVKTEPDTGFADRLASEPVPIHRIGVTVQPWETEGYGSSAHWA